MARVCTPPPAKHIRPIDFAVAGPVARPCGLWNSSPQFICMILLCALHWFANCFKITMHYIKFTLTSSRPSWPSRRRDTTYWEFVDYVPEPDPVATACRQGGRAFTVAGPRMCNTMPASSSLADNYEHVYSPTRQRDRQRQIIYSWLKYTVNSSYTVT